MQLPRSYCLPLLCSSTTITTTTTTTAKDDTPSISGDQTRSQTLLLTPTTSDSSSSSEIPSSSSPCDDTVSLQTLPSLPSLQSLLPSSQNTPPLSSTHLCLSSLQPHHSTTTSLAVSASSPLLLYSASDSQISVHDLTSLRHIESFSASPNAGSVKSITFSADGKVLTAHQDCKIRVWKPSQNSNRHRLLTSLPTALDRLRRLPLPSNYVTIRRHRKRLWIEHADAVTAVAVRGMLIYSVSWDKTLKIWRASDLRCLESVTAHDDAVNAIAVAGDGTVYTGSADRRIRVWGKGQGEKRHGLIATLERHRSAVNALALSGDGSVLYSGACDRSILVWEREESANHMVVSGALRGHGRAILCLACSGDLLFSGSNDRTVRIWRRGGEAVGYSCLGVMEGHVRGVRSLVAFPVVSGEEEEYRVCSGGLDGEVRVWQVRVSSVKRSDSS